MNSPANGSQAFARPMRRLCPPQSTMPPTASTASSPLANAPPSVRRSTSEGDRESPLNSEGGTHLVQFGIAGAGPRRRGDRDRVAARVVDDERPGPGDGHVDGQTLGVARVKHGLVLDRVAVDHRLGRLSGRLQRRVHPVDVDPGHRLYLRRVEFLTGDDVGIVHEVGTLGRTVGCADVYMNAVMLGMPMVGRMFHIVRHVILLADGGRMLGVLRLGSMLHLAVRRRAVLGLARVQEVVNIRLKSALSLLTDTSVGKRCTHWGPLSSRDVDGWDMGDPGNK